MKKIGALLMQFREHSILSMTVSKDRLHKYIDHIFRNLPIADARRNRFISWA